jgi:hypothetical protein
LLFCCTAAWPTNAIFTFVNKGLTGSPIRFSSPTLVDLDGNPNTLEIVVGDESGTVYGFDSAGNSLWSFSIRNFPGFVGVQTACQSSPAVADLDNDGTKEVIVTLASRDELVPSKPGAIFMFHLDSAGKNPTIAGGFARQAIVVNPTTTPSGFFASPTVADLDGDGDLEIIAGSWDYTCYAFHHNGSLVWNLDYDLTNNQEYGFVTGDTIWTTPVVADIDNDGAKEVVYGADAHDFPWGHQIPFQSHNGGILIVLEALNGHLKHGPPEQNRFFVSSYHEEGFGWYYNAAGENHVPKDNPSEVLQSSPVVGDVDADGFLEIVHGTGQTYYNPSDDLHERVFCWNGENATLSWSREVEDEVFASPVLANVDSGPDLEVFVRNYKDSSPRLYGIKGSTGGLVPGFPVPIKAGNPRSIGAVVGDVDGDGEMEIILISYGRLHVFSASGVEESNFDNAPGAMFTSPAIGDIDGDGQCEMVLGTDTGIYIYRCNGKVGAIPWGQYRRDAYKSGVVPSYDSVPASVTLLANPVGGESVPVRVQFHNIGSSVWTPNSVELYNHTTGWPPEVISLPWNAAVANGQTLTLEFSLQVPRQRTPFTLIFQLRQLGGPFFGRTAIQDVVVNDLTTGAGHWQHYR